MYVRYYNYRYERSTEHRPALLVYDGQISESYSRDEIVYIFVYDLEIYAVLARLVPIVPVRG